MRSLYANNALSFSVRELEDLIIDCIYSDLLRGKLNQQRQCLTIHAMTPRDVAFTQLESTLQSLKQWRQTCQDVKLLLENENEIMKQKRKIAEEQQKSVQIEANRQKQIIKDAFEAGGGLDGCEDEEHYLDHHHPRKSTTTGSRSGLDRMAIGLRTMTGFAPTSSSSNARSR